MWKKVGSFFSGGPKSEVERAVELTEADRSDARKRYVFAVLAVSCEGDPGYMPEHANKAVRTWYRIGTPDELVRRMGKYLDGTTERLAYDTFRAAFLARAGFAAGLIAEPASWDWALRASRIVQARFAGFEQYGLGYLEGHLWYRAGQGDAEGPLDEVRRSKLALFERLKKDVWTTPFTTPL
jgi:hypothetical protein